MTGDELKEALAALKLSQVDLSIMLAVSRQTVTRWATDKVPVPVHVVFILRMLRLVGIPIWMMPPDRKPGRKVGFSPPKKRKRKTKRAARE
jgi:hypothetical protein